MKLQVRDARLTDIDRISGLIDRADTRWTHEQLNKAVDAGPRMCFELVRTAVPSW